MLLLRQNNIADRIFNEIVNKVVNKKQSLYQGLCFLRLNVENADKIN